MPSRSANEDAKVKDVNVTVTYMPSDAAEGGNADGRAEQPRKLKMQVRLEEPTSPTYCPPTPAFHPTGLIGLELNILSPYSMAANVLEQRFFPPDDIPAVHHLQGQKHQQQNHPVAAKAKKVDPIIIAKPKNKAALKVLKQIRKKKRPSEVLREVRTVTHDVISLRREVREATNKYRQRRLNGFQSSPKVST